MVVALVGLAGVIAGTALSATAGFAVQRRLSSRNERRETYISWTKTMLDLPQMYARVGNEAAESDRVVAVVSSVTAVQAQTAIDASNAIRKRIRDDFRPAFDRFNEKLTAVEDSGDSLYAAARRAYREDLLSVVASIAAEMAHETHGAQ